MLPTLRELAARPLRSALPLFSRVPPPSIALPCKVSCKVLCRTMAFVLCVLFSHLSLAEKVSFTFAYDVQEGFPSFMGEGERVPADYPGTYIELLREVEKRVPIELRLERLPWERCKAYLKLNRVDSINSSFKSSRQEIGVFPMISENRVDTERRITSDSYLIYAKRGSTIAYDPISATIKNTDKGVVAPLGYSIVGDLKKKGINVQESPGGVSSIMKMLAYDRVTGVIAHASQANYVLSRNPQLFKGIEATATPIKEKEYYILISKAFYRQHPELAERIWDVIGELRESHMPKIISKYMDLASQP